MNTSKLKTFAQQSRRILMEGVKQKLLYWGFNAKGEVTDELTQVGGGVIIRGEAIDDPTVLPKWEALRDSIRRHGINATIEEAAYTWFNRMMAIRILGKNGYDPAQLEYEDAGSRLPVIVAKARRGIASYLNKNELARLQLFLTDYSQETRAFAILITGYCHSHGLLNRVFGRLNDYTELLLPDNILAPNGFIHLLNTTDAITDDDYRQVELIGWLYQFYISEKKDEVFAGFKKNQKARPEDIPAATQIFTPNWIVKYMVQNTAGRIWLDHHPESKLRETMKYLVEAPEAISEPLPPFGGTEGGQNAPKSQQSIPFEEGPKVSNLRGDGRGAGLLPNGDPIHLKLLDPATGSGHILVEGFSLLYEMYMEEFYLPIEAVENILAKNLFGLELDLRAAQLARFAVLLAAATKVPEILKKDILPRIYAMPEPAVFSRQEILDFLGSEGTQHEKVLTNALQLMQQAQNLGSVMQFNITAAEREFFKTRRKELHTEARSNLTLQALEQKLEPFLDILFTLTRRYEAIAANPPYMRLNNMNDDLKSYINDHFTLSKTDLFAVFIDVCLNCALKGAKVGMITQHAWMFLSSFEELRKLIIRNHGIESIIHLGPRTFDEISGEVVQSAAFTLNKESLRITGTYHRLVEYNNNEEKRLNFLKKSNYYPFVTQKRFEEIPGSRIGYWISDLFLSVFKNKVLNDLYEPKSGVLSGKDSMFVRNWHEVYKDRIGFNIKNYNEFVKFNYKWIPISNGGSFRRWYGNLYNIINLENQGHAIKSLPNNNYRLRNPIYYFKQGINWTLFLSGDFCVRESPAGILFGNGSRTFFPDSKNILFLMAYFNTKIVTEILEMYNPTTNFVNEDIAAIPVIYIKGAAEKYINNLTLFLMENSKDDWNSHETSWDFQYFPLLLDKEDKIIRIDESFNNWLNSVSKQYYLFHFIEEELNRIFIDIYGLNDEFDPLVPLKDITILQEELNRNALEETDKELRRSRQWRLEDGIWQLYVNNLLVSPPAEGELPACIVQPALPIKKEVVARQLISYAIGCMMGRYSLQKPGLILANQGETLDDYVAKVQSSEFRVSSSEGEQGAAISTTVISKEARLRNLSPVEEISPRSLVEMTDNSGASPVSPLGGTEGGPGLVFIPDDDAIIPLMGTNCGFADDALFRLRHFIEVVWGSQSLTQNINFLQSCLDMELERYLTNQNNFWKDHCSRYKKKPIYWLFSSPTGAFQVLTYMHRMNRFTVQKIRDNYLLRHIQWLGGQINQMESRRNSLVRDEQKKLDWMIKAQKECEAYDLHLKDIADRQIEFDLDDGVSVNYPKFEPVVAAIK